MTVTFAHGAPAVPFTRQNDSYPFIGGDYSYGYNVPDGDRQTCSLGIAVEDSRNQDGLMEAGHCFTPNNGVYTQNFGHFIGTPGNIADHYDAEIVWTGEYNGAGSNADEGESNTPGGIKYFPLVDVKDPYNGEYVCQDGIQSFLLGRGVPCNLKVGAPIMYDLREADGVYTTVDGISAFSNNGKPVAARGDSGAVVFTIHSASTRNAVGMVSAGPAGCDPNCTEVYFIPANAILGAFGVRLNPHQ